MHFHDEAEHDDVPFRFEGAPGRGHQIVVTAQKRQWLAGRWEHQWRRPPTGEELDQLVEDFVREEVLYREALVLGLDLADLVVRRRLVQKMEVLAFAGSAPLGNPGVMGYFLAHREDYRVPSGLPSRTPSSAPPPAAPGPRRMPERRGPSCAARGTRLRPGWVTRRWRRVPSPPRHAAR